MDGDSSTSITDLSDGCYAHQFSEPNFHSQDILSMLEADLEHAKQVEVSHKSTTYYCTTLQQLLEPEMIISPNTNRKLSLSEGVISSNGQINSLDDGQQKVSHITVERNRRKQMNHHLTILRSLMPCFYVKRGDQASIIGGVVDYIIELQQVLQSLQAKKQRKAVDVLSPIRPSPLSPRKPPLSPMPLHPISPQTPQPQPISPYRACRLLTRPPNYSLSPSTSSSTSSVDDLVTNSKNPSIADVEVKFSGSNLLKRQSHHGFQANQ